MKIIENLKRHGEFVSMFIVYIVGTFFGTLNKAWGYFLLSFAIFIIFLLFIIIFGSSKNTNTTGGKK